jgi:arylsulfatase
MTKNIIIAVLAFLNLILMAGLVYIGVNRGEPPRLPASTTVSPTPSTAPQEVVWSELGPQEFTYTAPVRLIAANAPAIVNRALTITAIFDTQDQDGVIIAQGGAANGYALYVQEGELMFAVRRNNTLTTVAGGKVNAGRLTITATLSKSGEITLARDGSASAKGLAAGMITDAPQDGLDIGADRGAPVGRYSIPNSFGGTIEIVSLKTTP